MKVRALSTVLLTAAAYALLVRPRLLRWGATDAEVAECFPGADLIPGATRSATMATTLNAPPSRLWPWLVQMGGDRGGWYSWDRLDNFGRRSADRVHPNGRTSRSAVASSTSPAAPNGGKSRPSTRSASSLCGRRSI